MVLSAATVTLAASGGVGPGAPLQTPPPQTSPVVHALPSSQAAVLLANAQPEAGLQLSSVHGLLSVQAMAVCTQGLTMPGQLELQLSAQSGDALQVRYQLGLRRLIIVSVQRDSVAIRCPLAKQSSNASPDRVRTLAAQNDACSARFDDLSNLGDL